MIERFGSLFALHTEHTSYLFRITPSGDAEHLYYGERVLVTGEEDAQAAIPKLAFGPGNTIMRSPARPTEIPECMELECAGTGRGEVGEPFVEVTHADGSFTTDFRYEEAALFAVPGQDAPAPGDDALPASYDDTGRAEGLRLTLRDEKRGLTLTLSYRIFPDCDVITRSARLTNDGPEAVTLRRLASAQLAFSDADWTFTTFRGAWAREMERHAMPLRAGTIVNASFTGTSSNRANPFVMLSRPDAGEDQGDVYGFNLVYSGNHREACEVTSFGTLRFTSGMDPRLFRWHLAPGESFDAPEAILAFSGAGFNGMSHAMHRFLRQHIVRGSWRDLPRPILLNSWEACYFHVSEKRILELARAAKSAGIELLVLDDGWFRGRNDDHTSLGDWTPDPRKLPHGLDGLAERVRAQGLDFGLWIEPEMVSLDSDLYRAHPDWALEIPGQPHAEGRSQRILDLTRREVQDYIIETVCGLLASADIRYIKWDMNRIFSDVYSQALPKDRQGEVLHRYQLGLYRCLREITSRYPKVLFEGCASGGNRFDPGMLCFFPQIWGSDNTDALCRADIQTGYSYGYPLSTVSAHVSNVPNHQTLRTAPLSTRFRVAAFGVLGYECDLTALPAKDLAEIRAQIELYKKYRALFFGGTFWRGARTSRTAADPVGPDPAGLLTWTVVSQDRSQAASLILQRLAVPNAPFHVLRPAGLDPDARYHFYNVPEDVDPAAFGDLINYVSPVRVPEGSLRQKAVSRFLRLPGEQEDHRASGSLLMHAGIRLHQSFAGSGFSGDVRYFPDFASRLYFMEKE